LSPSENLDVLHINLPSNNLDDWSAVASRIAMASIGSGGTMGGLLAAGFVSCIFRINKVSGRGYA
jgi:hypothetical protein